jgi:hypothetical protein
MAASSRGGSVVDVLRSIGAVIAGFVVVVLLSTGADFVLETTHLFPPPQEQLNRPDILAIALAYRCLFTVVGGWVTARIAADRPVFHALVLGGIGTLAAIAGCIVMWSYGQHWYPIALVIAAIPCCWLGGWLVQRGAPAGEGAAA